MANDDGQSIAEELSAQQREISVAEFFEQNRQMLGFGSKARAMVTAVKEGVDNSIDAAEDAHILPEVRVTVTETDDGHYSLTITDNGPGITEEQVPKVFGKLLYGSRFSKRVQRRGQQGIGISAAVLYGQLTTGKPAEVTSKVQEKQEAEYFEVGIDTDENDPQIRESRTVDWPFDHASGTSITIYLEANFRGRSSLHKYIDHTAIVNPHATVELNEPEKSVRHERTVSELPEQPTEINPHPHGIELGTLRSLIEVTDSHSISGFLQSEFTRVGQTTADDIVAAFMDRVHGRYCSWEVPDPTKEIPELAVANGHHHPRIDEGESPISTGEDDGSDVETVTLVSHIKDHVNRKGKEATEAFARTTAESLHDSGRVSWESVQRTTQKSADAIEDEYGATFGETVREKAARAAWDVIRTTRHQTITAVVDAATSDRKSASDVNGFSEMLTKRLDQAGDYTSSFTKAEIESAIDRVAESSADEIDNAFGDTAQSNVFTELWEGMERTRKDPALLRELRGDRDLANSLHHAMKDVDVMAPPSHCLSPIGEDALQKGIEKVYDAEFYATSTRDASAHSGEPFLVESGIVYGGEMADDGDVDLLRFANRVPLVYQQGACCITSVVSNIRWNNYKLSDKGSGLPQGPVAIVVHVASTNVPFTSESKDAVASVDVIEDEIERAVRDVARELKSHLKQKRTLQQRKRKQDTIAQLLPEFSRKIAEMTGKPQPSTSQSLAQIMNNLLVLVEPSEDGEGQYKILASNFDNQSTYSPVIEISVDSKPDSISSVEYLVDENEEGGWTVTWNPTLDSGEEENAFIPIECGSITEMTVRDVPDEKVTTAIPESVAG